MNNPVRSLNQSDLLDILCLSNKAIAIYTAEDIIIEFANNTMINRWGKDQQIIGKPLQQALTEPIDQTLIPILQEVWRTGISYSGFDFEYQAIQNEQGLTYAILHTASGTNQLKESKDRFASLVKNAPVAITYLKTENLQIELANQKMLELWGRNSEQVIGLSLVNDEHQLADPEQIALLQRVYQTGDPYFGFSVQVHLLAAFSAFKRYFDVVYQPVIDEKNQITGVMMVATDVTEHALSYQREKDLTDQLAKSNAELAAYKREVRILSEELEEARNAQKD